MVIVPKNENLDGFVGGHQHLCSEKPNQTKLNQTTPAPL